ncbi:MAG: hypothetical protein JW867_03505 [Candidatus Omnitrophica bacterium]|nr:hypothetical protein [Candidatus Omnitrophota bacterium]
MLKTRNGPYLNIFFALLFIFSLFNYLAGLTFCISLANAASEENDAITEYNKAFEGVKESMLILINQLEGEDAEPVPLDQEAETSQQNNPPLLIDSSLIDKKKEINYLEQAAPETVNPAMNDDEFSAKYDTVLNEYTKITESSSRQPLNDSGLTKALEQKITLNFSQAALTDVLRTLSDSTSLNIIAGPSVEGQVTVHLVDVPLGTALNSILLANGYTFVKEDSILRVVSFDEIEESPASSLTTKVFNLKFQNAEDIKATVSQFLSDKGLIQTFTRTKDDSTLIRSNTLVVRDTKEVLDNITGIIDKIDVEPMQISISAKVIEVIADDTDKLGVDWTVTGSLTGASIPTTAPFTKKRDMIDQNGLLIPKPDPTNEDFLDTNASLFPYASSDDFTFGSLSFSSFQAVLNLLDHKDKSNLLSAPHIATIDGEEAIISIATNIPIPIYERNESTGSMEITGYEEEQTGIILKVTPHVVGDNKIMLKVYPEISELTGQSVGPNNERPITTSRKAETTITIKDGDSVVIGGLIKDNIAEKNHRIPIIGDIPFLGVPFRYTEKTVDKTELLIFITPHIIPENNFNRIDHSSKDYSLKEVKKK